MVERQVCATASLPLVEPAAAEEAIFKELPVMGSLTLRSRSGLKTVWRMEIHFIHWSYVYITDFLVRIRRFDFVSGDTREGLDLEGRMRTWVYWWEVEVCFLGICHRRIAVVPVCHIPTLVLVLLEPTVSSFRNCLLRPVSVRFVYPFPHVGSGWARTNCLAFRKMRPFVFSLSSNVSRFGFGGWPPCIPLVRSVRQASCITTLLHRHSLEGLR